MCGSRKYPYRPHRRNRISRGEGGGAICLIFQRGGGHHRKIFPVGSRDAKECNKEKTQKLTTIIYLQRYKTRQKLKSH